MTRKQTSEGHLARLYKLIDHWLDMAEETGDDAKARTSAMLVGEARKIAKAEASQQDEYTVDRVVEWHRSLPAPERLRVVRALQANLDAKKSGLA
jgi:hypothetical protein